ncbi:hypothetical protein COO60DRAFT_1501033, partial [Scenedesmus sp. NREL 46B-D3]
NDDEDSSGPGGSRGSSSSSGSLGDSSSCVEQEQQPAGVGAPPRCSAWEGGVQHQFQQQRQWQRRDHFHQEQQQPYQRYAFFKASHVHSATLQRSPQVVLASASKLIAGQQRLGSTDISLARVGSSRLHSTVRSGSRSLSCLRTLPAAGYVTYGNRVVAGTACFRSSVAI